ncbi:Hypothetical predicted protein [Pelobates cultripes]|uniref:Uncharacterized protein n=1 Tax=Pelobates cultripes TaxID=61616 RepID=A0AAD1R3T1_PELCU|nr:Hypothetical predicted protein [Pelobates cultripes]
MAALIVISRQWKQTTAPTIHQCIAAVETTKTYELAARKTGRNNTYWTTAWTIWDRNNSKL